MASESAVIPSRAAYAVPPLPTPDAAAAARYAHSQFLRLVEPHREELWRYCRHLCLTPWDAEDLLQETLAKAYAKLPLLWQAVSLPQYLRRMAKNCWLDGLRRKRNLLEDALADDSLEGVRDSQGDPLAIRVLFEDILGRLPPRMAAVLLMTVAGFSGAEIGSRLGMSPGAVRVTLSRARTKLSDQNVGRVGRQTPLLDRFVLAYNDRDADALCELLAEHVQANIVGVAEEVGRHNVIENSISDDFAKPGLRAEAISLLGLPIIVVVENDALVQIMQLKATTSEITEIRTYFFCPEVLAEVAEMIGMKARNNGYSLDVDGAV